MTGISTDFFNKFKNINHKFLFRYENELESDYFQKINNIFQVKQVHGNDLYFLDKKTELDLSIQADGILTFEKGIKIGIRSSDCLPILIYSQDIGLIGAIHSGWKSLYSGIIENFVDFIINKNGNLLHLNILIGPSIKQKNYPVNEKFKHDFLLKYPFLEFCFLKQDNNIYFALDLAAISILQNLNIIKENIYNINIDTFEDQRFTSFRRLKFNNEDKNILPKNFCSYVEINE